MLLGLPLEVVHSNCLLHTLIVYHLTCITHVLLGPFYLKTNVTLAAMLLDLTRFNVFCV